MTLTPAQKCESETNCEWMVDWFLTDTDERKKVIAVIDHATRAPIFAAMTVNFEMESILARWTKRAVGAVADIHRGC